MRLLILLSALLACAPSARANSGENEFRRYYIDIYGPAFSRPAPGKAKFALREAQNPAEFAVPKPAGVKRIVLVGGSVANYMGRWPEDVSWEKRVGALKPGTTFEIINCGVPAYDAYRDSLILGQALAFEPDLIVVMSGNNEYYRPVSLRFPRLSLWLGRLRRGREAGRPDPAARDAQFEKSLRGMAKAARAKGVPLAFCTLPNNREDLPPHSALPFEFPEFREAWLLTEKGKRPEAAAALRRFLARPLEGDVEAQGRFYLGRASADPDESRAAYARAADLDPGEQQCPPRRNELIRRVAREEGALLVDLDAAFASLPDGQRFGVFYDAVHWVPEFNPFAAAVIAESLAGALGLDAEAALAWTNRARGARRDEDYVRAAVFAGAQTGARGIEAADALSRRWPKDVLRLMDDKPLFLERAASVKTLGAGDGGTPEKWWPALLRSLAVAQRRRGRPGPAEALLLRARLEDPEGYEKFIAEWTFFLGDKR